MDKRKIAELISSGQAVLGIEFGSTRIKAVLVGEDNAPIASGSHDWENRLVDNIWTYSMEDISTGLQGCYADLKKKCERRVWRDTEASGCNRIQWDDAWVSAV